MTAAMKNTDISDDVDGPVVSEGGRIPSTLSPGQAKDTASGTSSAPEVRGGPLGPGQRWSVARKREVVLRLLRGESVEMLSRELAVPIFKLEHWRQKAEGALDRALKEREADPADGQLADALRRVGELRMENELPRIMRDNGLLSPHRPRPRRRDANPTTVPSSWRRRT